MKQRTRLVGAWGQAKNFEELRRLRELRTEKNYYNTQAEMFYIK